MSGTAAADGPLLETRALTKRFGETRAVDAVDFRVTRGEVLALIGSNGAGKTTLVNLVSGLLAPDAHIVCLVTGTGFKDEASVTRMLAGVECPVIELDDLRRMD